MNEKSESYEEQRRLDLGGLFRLTLRSAFLRSIDKDQES